MRTKLQAAMVAIKPSDLMGIRKTMTPFTTGMNATNITMATRWHVIGRSEIDVDEEGTSIHA